MRSLTLLLALTVSACGSAAFTPITRPAAAACPNPDGGVCLGALAPGTYTTQSFAPAITYRVTAGWTNGEDLPGNFLLQRTGDPRYLGIYRDANAPYMCEEHPDPDVSQSVADYTRWLRRHPLLHVTKPRPVTVGGLHGVVMDISKRPGAEGQGCTFGEFRGTVPFIVGGRGPASLHHVILDTPGFEERLYLLRYKRGNVAIEVGPEGQSLPEYLREAMPIIQSLRFAR
jgi:hypothetical protein